MVRASIIGGSGYTGGELLRLLLAHPEIEVIQVTSRQKLGEYVYQTHPNLRAQTSLKFTSPEKLQPTDMLFLALPHGQAQHHIERYAEVAGYIIDLSSDFRLRSPEFYEEWYEEAHAAPDWLVKFVYGLPEIHREELRQAKYVSGVGCNATASNLALLPLIQADLLDTGKPVIIELKVGSSEGGASVNPGSHHPERSSVIRTYAPYGHRHTAEVIQEMGLLSSQKNSSGWSPDQAEHGQETGSSKYGDSFAMNVSLTMTSVDLVRGALATVHGYVKDGVDLKDLWKAYRSAAAENPFLRVVKERRGIYRVPEPKILAGSNYADVGFDLDPATGHVISICAIDNLMKGASGSAVQSMNLMLGLDETLGLEFPGLHPI